MTAVAKVFKNGRSQAIRLPKEYRVNSEEVFLEKIGDSILIIPKYKKEWDIVRDALEKFEGFDFERKQPRMQERDLF